jgi:hypothetical protein
VISDRLHRVHDVNHVGQTLSRRELQQRSNLRYIHAAFILDDLLLTHSSRIEKIETGGAIGLESTTTRF